MADKEEQEVHQQELAKQSNKNKYLQFSSCDTRGRVLMSKKQKRDDKKKKTRRRRRGKHKGNRISKMLSYLRRMQTNWGEERE